ncbi:MAG: hypothetical protein HYU67_12930 [Flavobacteriia bacterium]|nr:hypothetical protein [Flavobacteriia bacterium]
MKKILAFYLYGNFHLSLCGFVLSYGFQNYFLKTSTVFLSTFVSIAIFIMYYIQQTFWHNINDENSDQTNWLLHNKKIFDKIFVGLFIIEIFLFFKLTFSFVQIIFLAFLSIISILYVFPRKSALRNIPYLKNFIISAIWTGTLFILPSIENFFSNNLWQVYSAFFIFYFLLTVIFDIKDNEKDSIKTFANLLGKKMQLLLHFLNIFLLFGFYLTPFFKDLKPEIFFINLYIYFLIRFIGKPNKLLYYHGLIDLSSLLLGLILYLK